MGDEAPAQAFVAASAINDGQKSASGLRLTQLMDKPSDTNQSRILPEALADAVRRRQRNVSVEPVGPNSCPTSLSSSLIRRPTFDGLMKPLDSATGKGDPAHSLLIVRSKNKSIATRNRGSCDCDRCLDTLCLDMPLRRQADAFVEMFFNRQNRMFPILHQSTFRRQYEWIWDSQSQPPNQERDCFGFCTHQSRLRLLPALLNTVFAFGALFAFQDPEQGLIKADEFFAKAKRVDLMEMLDDDIGLEPVQLGLLMSLYLENTERFSKCWNTLGLSIRMAQNKGLHLDAADAHARGYFGNATSQLEREMRVRVWYACVLLDT